MRGLKITNYIYEHRFYLDFKSWPITMNSLEFYQVKETRVFCQPYDLETGTQVITFMHLVEER